MGWAIETIERALAAEAARRAAEILPLTVFGYTVSQLASIVHFLEENSADNPRALSPEEISERLRAIKAKK